MGRDKEKQKVYQKRYREEHKEELRDMNRKWREENAKELKEKKKKYREENKEKIQQHKKDYAAEHPELVKKQRHESYLRRKNKVLAAQKERYEQNKEDILAYLKNYREEHKNDLATYEKFYEKLKPYYQENIKQDPKNPELILIKCYRSECDNWVNPTVSQVLGRYRSIIGKSAGDHNIYCCDECKKLCPVFNTKVFPKGFKSKNNYDREAQPELRELVLKRDNYTCQHDGCGKSLAEFPDLVLHCHHKFPLNEDPACSADIDNCITLCEECHRWVHMNVPGCSYAELRCTKNHPLNNQEDENK